MFKPGWHPYPMVRGGGSFLFLIGTGLLLGVLTAVDEPVNTRPFLWGAALGLISIPVVRRRWRLGSPTLRQVIALVGSICMQLVFFALLSRMLGADPLPRDRWLYSLLIVGIHFLPMYWSFGPRIVLLGVLSICTAGIGLLSPGIPFVVLGSIDAALKIVFGLWMFLTPARSPAGSHGSFIASAR